MIRHFTVLVCALAQASPAAPADHVVLVSVDGMAAYQLYDQELHLPNIRKLIAKGVWAASSQTVFPSVTHPSHTSMVTGVEPRLHGVLSNLMVNRETGEQFHPTNKARRALVRVPTIFDAARAANLKTAAFFWPETKEDPSIDFNFPEVFNADKKADIKAIDPKFLAELRAGEVPIDSYFRWYGTDRMAAADGVLAEAAAYVIKRHRPHLLAIHLLAGDEAQHEHGPHHYLGRAALTMADHAVGILMDAVTAAGLAERTAFVITSDHGFHSVKQEASVRPAFEKAGLAGRVKFHGGGWAMWLELLPAFQPARDQSGLETAFETLRNAGIVRRVVRPDDLHELGLPRFEENSFVAGHYILIPDIDTFLTPGAPDGKLEFRSRATHAHTHGYLPEHPRMRTSLVLSGAGFRRGVTIGHTSNLNIAPTIAHLLGLTMPKMQGNVIREALAP